MCRFWSPGDIRDASPGFPLFNFHLDGKTGTAACSDTIAHSSSFCRWSGSYVVGRSGEKGPPRGCRATVSLSPSLRGSIGLGHQRWVCYPGSWSPGDIQDASPGFPLFNFHLDGKTGTAACSDTIAHSSSFRRWSGSYVVGRSGEKGPPRGCRATVSLSPSLRGSIGLGHQRWVCHPGSEGGTDDTYFSGVNSPALDDHLTSWDRKPEDSNTLHHLRCYHNQVLPQKANNRAPPQ